MLKLYHKIWQCLFPSSLSKNPIEAAAVEPCSATVACEEWYTQDKTAGANVLWLLNVEGLATVPHHIHTSKTNRALLGRGISAAKWHSFIQTSSWQLPWCSGNSRAWWTGVRTAQLKSGSTPRQWLVDSSFLNFLSITFCHPSNSDSKFGIVALSEVRQEDYFEFQIRCSTELYSSNRCINMSVVFYDQIKEHRVLLLDENIFILVCSWIPLSILESFWSGH